MQFSIADSKITTCLPKHITLFNNLHRQLPSAYRQQRRVLCIGIGRIGERLPTLLAPRKQPNPQAWLGKGSELISKTSLSKQHLRSSCLLRSSTTLSPGIYSAREHVAATSTLPTRTPSFITTARGTENPSHQKPLASR